MIASVAVPSRPRPPARARRTSSNAPPDEQYPNTLEADIQPQSFPTISASHSRRRLRAVTTTTTSTTFLEDEGIPSPTELRPAVNDVLSGRSREELQEMLLAAHNIIRKHENDLTRSTTETQYLRDQNLELKSRFEKLSARLPQSPRNQGRELARSPSVFSFTEAADGAASPPPMSPPMRPMQTPLRGHRSRPSMASPIALAQLADQNAELVHKLDQLEQETNLLDQTGRRKLQKLEKEIDLLKEDLERVQRRNAELEKEREEKERQARANEAEQLRRRLEREERARAVRDSLKRSDSDGEEIIRDFAPSSSTSISSFTSPVRGRSRQSTSGYGGAPIPFSLDMSTIHSVGDAMLESAGPSAAGTMRARTISGGETAIVVQLLSKIEELETANREIIRQRAETEAKILSATEQVTSMRQAYREVEDDILQNELYGDVDELPREDDDWVDEAEVRRPPAPSMVAGPSRTRKLSDVASSSPRPQVPASPVKSLRSRSSKGSLKSSRSGPRGAGNIRMMAKRARKPLTNNMFLSPPTSPSISGSPAIPQDASPFSVSSNGGSPGFLRPPNPHLSSTRRNRQRFAAADFSDRGDTMPRSSSSSNYVGHVATLRSAPSFGDMGRYIGALGLSSPRRTLESELAAEYGDDWMSQEEITREMFEIPENPASGDTSFGSVSSSNALMEMGERGLANNNAAVVALTEALDPRNRGRVLEEDEHILPLGCLRDAPADTFYGLEQAVEARPQRWRDINTPQQRLIGTSLEPPSSPMQSVPPRHHTEPTVDPWESNIYASDLDPSDRVEDNSDAGGSMNPSPTAVVRHRPSFAPSDDGSIYDDAYEIIPADGEEGRTEKYYGSQSRYDPKALAAKLRNSSLDTFLEVWLILQFVMVLAVFIYSSVRQGPRAVMLGQAGTGGSPAGRKPR